jgi:hypothetical protein
MRCQFSNDNSDYEDVNLDGQVISMKDAFQYLRSMLQSDWGINENVSHKIRAEWTKWRQTYDIFCDKVPNKLKDKSYRTVIRSGMMYGAKYWATK